MDKPNTKKPAIWPPITPEERRRAQAALVGAGFEEPAGPLWLPRRRQRFMYWRRRR